MNARGKAFVNLARKAVTAAASVNQPILGTGTNVRKKNLPVVLMVIPKFRILNRRRLIIILLIIIRRRREIR
jgi:hypothetical protein